LTLQYDEPLSNFASNFNVRRYSKGRRRAKHLLRHDAEAQEWGASVIPTSVPPLDADRSEDVAAGLFDIRKVFGRG